MKTKKKKPGFMDCYDRPDRRYDPEKEGFGNPHQWKAAFAERMGWDEAQTVIGTDEPHTVLGVSSTASTTEIKSAWRRFALRWHPDKWPPEKYSSKEIKKAETTFKKGLAAYTILMEN